MFAKDAGAAERLQALLADLFASVYKRVARGLLHDHGLVLALRLCEISLLGASTSAELPEVEAQWLWRGATTLPTPEAVERASALGPSLSPVRARAVASLLALPGAPWRRLEDALRKDEGTGEWTALLAAPSAGAVVPSGWECRPDDEEAQESSASDSSSSSKRTTVLSLFRHLLVLRALRPDALCAGLERFVGVVLGDEFVSEVMSGSGGGGNLSSLVQTETSAASPILLASEPGFDASTRVDALAAAEKKQYVSVAMGSAEGCVT